MGWQPCGPGSRGGGGPGGVGGRPGPQQAPSPPPPEAPVPQRKCGPPGRAPPRSFGGGLGPLGCAPNEAREARAEGWHAHRAAPGAGPLPGPAWCARSGRAEWGKRGSDAAGEVGRQLTHPPTAAVSHPRAPRPHREGSGPSGRPAAPPGGQSGHAVQVPVPAPAALPPAPPSAMGLLVSAFSSFL